MGKSLRKAYEITDAKIQFVSLVDKAANKRKFLLTKADGGKASFTTYGRIVKADAENHYVTGIVYEPMAEDSHGNFMTEDEITKAAYWFAKNGDRVDVQHSFEPLEGATIVENWIAKADFEVGGEQICKGTWLMTVEVADEGVWAAIEKGEITGFSMGGLGNYSEEDVELDTVNKQDSTEKRGLFKQLAKAFGFDVVEKGAMADLYTQRAQTTLFWEAFYALQDTLNHYDSITGRYIYETDEAKLREALEDFSNILTNILAGENTGSIAKALAESRPVEKAGKKMSGKNKDTLTGIYESLGAFLKEFDEPDDTDPDKKKAGEAGGDGETKTDKEEKDVTKQDVETIVASAIAKAMGGNATQQAEQPAPAQAGQDGAAPVEKAEEAAAAPADTVTPEGIEKMVQDAIAKALAPQEEHLSAQQVQEMITSAVEKAVEPVLKSRGLPSNLNGGGTVEKSEEPHYLHGIL